MIGRSIALVGALSMLALSACGENGAMTVAADGAAPDEADSADDAPSADDATPHDATSDELAAGTGAQQETESAAADVDDDRPEPPDFEWPPVTLAPGEPPVMPETVTVIGDSIALSAQEIITDAIESLGVGVIAYDAVASRRMVAESVGLPSGASAISDLVDDDTYPELWIVALGTNDVGAVSDIEAARADIEHVLDLIPEEAHLIWVDTWARPFDDDAVAFNALLREVLADRPYTTVLDWHTKAAIDGLIIGDGVHLSDVGKIEYARMIGDGLRAAFDRG